MDDSLESLLEKATNPKNQYEDWEFIMSFCDRVNLEQDGPQMALKMIVPKMRHENEKVNMLALTLLEACVKNCGQRFHQELGKFRFLNELIKMLSEKYLGKQTPGPVKERIKALLYSWKVGLPTEGKISDAYEMLKKEGLVFDESQPPDATLKPEKQKPKVTLAQDPKQAKILQRLLASKNPDDLRAANRLIREMVRRDEKRMEKMQKRLDELELVQNNIKLMNELLSHYRPDSGDQERQLLQELYQSLEKMRPNVLRMASNLKPEEEGMDEILQTNDDLLRVLDAYKRMVGVTGVTERSGASVNGETVGKGEGVKSEVPEEAGAAGGGMGLGLSGGGGGGGGDASTLIDLADLDFGALPPTSGVAPVTPSTADSLLDALGTLDFSATGAVPATSLNTSLLDFPPILTTLAPASQPQATPTNTFPIPSVVPQLTGVTPGTAGPQPFVLPPPPSSQNPVLAGLGPQTQARPQLTTATTLHTQQPFVLNNATPPTGAATNDLLGNLNLDLNLGPQLPPSLNLGSQLPPRTSGSESLSGPQAGWGGFQSDPLAVLTTLTVTSKQIKPSTLPPLQVMNKNGILVSLHFTNNLPAPNVTVMVITAMNTNTQPVKDFQVQVAVPKVMRVKLQPPTGTELAPYNPILPPASLSQIMLLANPSKETVRLKYRISWKLGTEEMVETGEVANFPQL